MKGHARRLLANTLLREMNDWATAHSGISDFQTVAIPSRVRAGVFLMLYGENACVQLHRLNRDSNCAEVRQLVLDACPCASHTPGSEEEAVGV